MMTVYAIGSNGSGQIGIGHKEDVSVPKEVIFTTELVQPITQVRAGGNHTLILSSGVVHSSGDTTTAARALSAASTSPRFDPLNLTSDGSTISNSDITFCAATWEATILVQKDTEGRNTRVYSFGTGNKGELGQGELIFRSAKPLLIKDFPPEHLEVTDIAASVSHVVVVLSNGDVYGWGNGRKGQLGQPEGIVHSPRKFSPLIIMAARAVCGREFTYLAEEPTSGKATVLGHDKYGVVSAAPQNLAGWKDVGAGWGSVFVLMQDGRLLSWGRDDHGQLTSPELPPLSQIAIGSEHGVGLTMTGEVVAWGWGEHGNCGPSTVDGDVKGKWNVITSSKYLPKGTKITGIGAGCATSWICLSTC